MVIIVFGLPGSGKSYFASRLAKKFKAWYVNSDGLRKELMPEPSYSTREKVSVYKAMLDMMTIAIGESQDIVLDATFYKKSIRNKFIATTERLNEKLIFIIIEADQNIIKERLNEKRIFSEADYQVFLKIKNEFESLEIDHLTLHSTQDNIEEMLEEAGNYIQLSNDRKTNS